MEEMEEHSVKKSGGGWKAAVIILSVLLVAAIVFDVLLVVWDRGEEIVVEDEEEVYADPDVVYLEITGEADETGVAPCIEYVYPCYRCEELCEGHDGYLSPSGNFYPFYPTLIEGDEILQIHSSVFDVSEVDEDGLFWIEKTDSGGEYYTIHTYTYPTFVYSDGLAVGFEIEVSLFFDYPSYSMEVEGGCSARCVYGTSTATNLFVFETPLGKGEYTLNIFCDGEARWEESVYSCSFAV